MVYRVTVATRAAKQERAAVLLCAAREIVAADGFGAASIKAITEQAGVSAGTVYTYFDSREELLVSVFRQAAGIELGLVREAVARADIQDDQTRAAREIRALVATFAERAGRGRRLAWALLVEPVGPLIDAERLHFRRDYANTLAEIVGRGVASGELPQQDPEIVGPGLVGLISEALTGPLSPLNAERLSMHDVIARVSQLTLRAIGSAR